MDADHLDIYEEKDEVIKSFNQFVDRIKPGGTLIIKYGLETQINRSGDIKIYTYSLENQDADFHGWDVRNEYGSFGFDLVSASSILKKILPGTHGIHNAENAIAACSVARVLDVHGEAIRSAIGSFSGVQRRFDYQIKEKNIILIDDYAHHPEEIKAFLNSVKKIYQDKKITGIFQPHLYSRTRDFYMQFAESLDLLDELILLDIYPAREKPIEGINSELILKHTRLKEKTLCSKVNLLGLLKTKNFEVLVMMGAGDIDTLVTPVKELLINKYKL
jgi:UDP-N-acetylmuramate--alanine ligase